MTNELDMKNVLRDLAQISPAGVAQIQADIREKLGQAVLHVEMLRLAAADLGVDDIEGKDTFLEIPKVKSIRIKVRKPAAVFKKTSRDATVRAAIQLLVSDHSPVKVGEILQMLDGEHGLTRKLWRYHVVQALNVAASGDAISGVAITKTGANQFDIQASNYEAKRLMPPEPKAPKPRRTKAKRIKLPRPVKTSKYRNPTKEVIAHAQRLVSARGKITSVDLLAELKRRYPSRAKPYWANTLRRILHKCVASTKQLIPGVVVTKYNHRVFTLAPVK